MESERGYDPKLWQALAEMGVLGLIVDPAYGGSGAGAVELELIMEQAGAVLMCGPYLSSAVLATALLNACDDEDARRRLLPAMARGATIASVALTGDAGTLDAAMASWSRRRRSGQGLDARRRRAAM